MVVKMRLEVDSLKVIVLGADEIGFETTKDLLDHRQIDLITIADNDKEKADEICRKLQSDKLMPLKINAKNYLQLESVLKDYNLLINTLSYEYIVPVAHAAIRARVHALDRGGHLRYFTRFLFALHEQAKEAEVTYIPDLGISPGVSNILASFGAHSFDSLDSLKIYAGSIPTTNPQPLNHKHLFPIARLLEQYNDLSYVIQDGKRKYVPPLSGIETIQFDRFPQLEAFYTAEGPSTLIESFPTLKTYEHKTIRHPGHAEKMQLLKDLHLTRDDYSVFLSRTSKVKPKSFFLKIAGIHLSLRDEPDAVLLKIHMLGKQQNETLAKTIELICIKEEDIATYATAYVIGSTLSIVAQMLIDGTIAAKGVYPPEKIVPSELFVQEMKKRKVSIQID